MNFSATTNMAKVVSYALMNQKSSKVLETTPVNITEQLNEFCNDICFNEPELIDVIPEEDGLHGFGNLTVEKKIKKDGGTIVFGWIIWEWPDIFWTAEFHAVWESPEGKLIDVTPKPDGETKVVFLRDLTFAPGFDFNFRPPNRRRRIRPDQNRAAVVNTVIERLNASQREYEQGRAEKAGMSLHEWIDKKTPSDELNDLIDATIAACEAHESWVDEHRQGGTVRPTKELENLIAVRNARMTRLKIEVTRLQSLRTGQ